MQSGIVITGSSNSAAEDGTPLSRVLSEPSRRSNRGALHAHHPSEPPAAKRAAVLAPVHARAPYDRAIAKFKITCFRDGWQRTRATARDETAPVLWNATGTGTPLTQVEEVHNGLGQLVGELVTERAVIMRFRTICWDPGGGRRRELPNRRFNLWATGMNAPGHYGNTMQHTIKVAIANAERDGHVVTVVEILARYAAAHPENAKYQYDYADALRAVGRLSEAEAILTSIRLDQVPQQRRYLIPLGLAEIYRETGRWNLAANEYARAASERPDSTVPWVYWGAFLSSQGRIREAMEVLARGLQAKGDVDEVHLNLGNCARALRDYERACSHYEAALSITPTYQEAAVALSDIRNWAGVVETLYGGSSLGPLDTNEGGAGTRIGGGSGEANDPGNGPP